MAEFAAVRVNPWCEDVERCAAFFRALGMPERFRFPREGEPHQIEVDSADGRLRFAWLRDPEGHRVRFVREND